MNALKFIRLFRMILGRDTALDTEAIERMGLLPVKIAQMYAVRSDLIGLEKCRELSRLLERATPLPFAVFKARLDHVAPRLLKMELDWLDEKPLATASLGQVHRGRLRNGAEIVVKLVKEAGRERFAADLRSARWLARWAIRCYPKLKRLADPLGVLEAVERQTLREMDLTQEIKGARRLEALASEHRARLPHLARFHVPVMHPELSNSDVLVSEFVAGGTISTRLREKTLGYEDLLALFRIHGYFLFLRGEFHGDIHPGNIILRDDGFWFLDSGCIETAPRALVHGLLQMLVGLGGGDFQAAAAHLESLSLKPLSGVLKNEFEKKFAALYDGFSGKSVSQTSLTAQMMETVKLAVHSGMKFPQGVFPVIKSLMFLDGMVVQAAPEAVLLRDVARFAGDFDVLDE